MTLRFVATPLEHPLEAPAPRPGAMDPALADAFVASSTREAQLERLRRPGALAVTTGQQPGLFTGPLYTVHKALSAVALAGLLEARWKRPVVPVFWSDNYVSLMPGEHQELVVRHDAGGPVAVELSGWNVPVGNVPMD